MAKAKKETKPKKVAKGSTKVEKEVPKKRGRPAKVDSAVKGDTKVKRGRGRPAKSKEAGKVDTVKSDAPKRRGRPPKTASDKKGSEKPSVKNPAESNSNSNAKAIKYLKKALAELSA